MRKKTRISAAIITKNAEYRFDECLSALGWVDEIVVVDCGSTDGTVKTAKKHGARVFMKEWEGFGRQKNFAVSKARGEWVLNVDADEIVSPELKTEMIKLLAGEPDKDAYDMPFKNFFYGRWIRHGGLYPDRHVRLFRKSRGEITDLAIHESLKISGETGSLRGHILHYSKKDIGAHINSVDIYTRIQLEQRQKRGIKPTGYTVFLRPLFGFIKNYIFKAGFLDGLYGLIFHTITAFGMFAGEIKVLERMDFKPPLLLTIFKRAR